MPRGSRYGAPGTRVGRVLSEGSELRLPIKDAGVILLCEYAILSVLLLMVVLTDWWMWVVIGTALGFFVSVTTLAIADRQHIAMPAWLAYTLGGLWCIGAVVGFCVGFFWWRESVQPLMLVLQKQLRVLLSLEWYWYAGAVVLPIVGMWRAKRVWPGLALLGLEALAAAFLVVRTQTLVTALHAARWILLCYVVLVPPPAMLLIPKMVIEIFWPNWEWTAMPVDPSQMGERGLVELYFPDWREEEEPAAPPGRTVQVEYTEDKSVQRPVFPDSNEARAFYRAIVRGEPFTLETANRFGVSRGVFEKDIRDPFIDLGWARWKNAAHHDQGVYLKGQGRANMRGLAYPHSPAS